MNSCRIAFWVTSSFDKRRSKTRCTNLVGFFRYFGFAEMRKKYVCVRVSLLRVMPDMLQVDNQLTLAVVAQCRNVR